MKRSLARTEKPRAVKRLVSVLPTEIELAIEVMPCQADRRIYERADKKHPCASFASWGVYHSYRYKDSGPPQTTGIEHPAIYEGKTYLAPEILSGCRKAPIMAVGINPNLPGYWAGSHNAINPLFQDLLQYAHYFRYRAIEKLQIPEAKYQKMLGSRIDGPQSRDPLTKVDSEIPIEPVTVSMYRIYQGLLDSVAKEMRWASHRLTVGEDLSYGNMVSCPSAKWLTARDKNFPEMPIMSKATVTGVVSECFHMRRYFLRQLFQSFPSILIVLSRATADAFLAAMGPNLRGEVPKPRDSASIWLDKKVFLDYGKAPGGRRLSARVIFAPHATGDPEHFQQMRDKVVKALVEEAHAGRIVLNRKTGHLHRSLGQCEFCTNSLYSIGTCDYLSELKPLSGTTGTPQSLSKTQIPPEKFVQQRMLKNFVRRAAAAPKTEAVSSSPFRILSA
jgi:hypothetical protein